MWIGGVANRFVIERAIGSGGMGAVFVATDRTKGARVAVKALELVLEGAVERFRREARLLSDLSTRGSYDTSPAVKRRRMSRFWPWSCSKGTTLPSVWLAPDSLSRRGIAVLRSAAEALAVAHEKCIVSDMKPSNPFLEGGDV
jgi:serine/threonine protein kinase